MSLHSDTFSWFQANQSLFLLLYAGGEAANINSIIFSMIQQVLKPMIYHTRGEHANHYTTNVMSHIEFK
jgi:hypothetical protein